MVRRGTGHGGRSARWLLLACTLFGLATMHTLGHGGMQMHAHGHHGHHGVQVMALAGLTHEFGSTNAAVTSVMSGVCDGGCAHTPGSSPHGEMSGWSVCLAVLVALVALLLLRMLIARSRGRGSTSSDSGWWAAVSRGPPGRSAGLAMAAGSVLRI